MLPENKRSHVKASASKELQNILLIGLGLISIINHTEIRTSVVYSVLQLLCIILYSVYVSYGVPKNNGRHSFFPYCYIP